MAEKGRRERPVPGRPARAKSSSRFLAALCLRRPPRLGIASAEGSGCAAKPLANSSRILRNPRIALVGRHCLCPSLPPLLCCPCHAHQQVSHLTRPRLLLLFADIDAIAHQVRSTDAVRARVLVIAGPPIAHGAPREAWPDANVLQCLLPSFRMPGQMRQHVRAIDMEEVAACLRCLPRSHRRAGTDPHSPSQQSAPPLGRAALQQARPS